MADSTGGGETTRYSPRRRILILLGVGLLPWTILLYDSGVSVVFTWGLANVPPLGITTIYEYVFTYTRELPRSLRAWPISTFLYACALASATAGLFWREDGRLTAGLLALAALSHLGFALAIRHPSQIVLPLGPLVVAFVVRRLYWTELRSIVGG